MAKLRGKQLRAISMITTGLSTLEIEGMLGVRPSTLSRWRSMPEFAARLEARKAAFTEDKDYAKMRLMRVLMEQYGSSMQSQLCNYDDPKRLATCLDVLKYATNPPKDAQTSTNLHKDAQTCTNVHKPAQTSTNLHEIAPKMRQKTAGAAELS